MKWKDRVLLYFSEPFQVCRWEDYDYSILRHIPCDQARGKQKEKINECFIMADTETSKSAPDVYTTDRKGKRVYEDNVNYVVKWSIAINVFGFNICVLWGSRPSELLDCMIRVHASLSGTCTMIYFHNLSYDYMFLRKFINKAWGVPVKQLNTKPHYPVELVYGNGITLRDSLILAQRSIEKWGEDLGAEHQKAVGKWEYEKIRHQSDGLTDDELLYICNDVLCGVECLNITRRFIHKTHRGMPYTATGIPRGELRDQSKRYHAHDWCVSNYEYWSYKICERLYHGGYTHNNRNRKGDIMPAKALDFSSSYPFTLLVEKFPMEKWCRMSGNPSPEWILSRADREAFVFRVNASRVRLKNYWFPMPPLQLSKMDLIYDAAVDNGRVLQAGFCSLLMNEIMLEMFLELYDYDELEITDCMFAAKRYLPDWMTSYVYQLFRDKTQLKGQDPVQYAIAKAKLNSIYGMCVQKIEKPQIIEDPETGDYNIIQPEGDEVFYKEVKKRSTFLWYPVGCWVTSYAMRNLFRLGACARDPETGKLDPDAWLYSDTDSCYFLDYDPEMVEAYNQSCRERLLARGFPGVEHNGKTYWLGVAELDGEYQEFRAWHSKCYAARYADNWKGDEAGKLKITVAGVPKKTGADCLEDDIRKFIPGFIFSGERTGKLTHIYNYVDEITANEHGDEIGDSINLIPCDYLLSPTIEQKINQYLEGEEVSINYYGTDEKTIL